MDRNRVPGVVVAGVAALLVVIGSVLPWISMSTPVGSIGFAGTNGHLVGSFDGTVTLVLALIAGACFGFSLLREDRVLPFIGLVIALATTVIAIYDLVHLGHQVARANSLPFASISIGYGLWITAVAALGMFVGSFMTLSAAPVGSGVTRRPVRPVARPLGQPATPEYWTRDPFGRHEQRWWNGNSYTDRVLDDGVESSDAPGPRAATQTGEPATGSA